MSSVFGPTVSFSTFSAASCGACDVCGQFGHEFGLPPSAGRQPAKSLPRSQECSATKTGDGVPSRHQYPVAPDGAIRALYPAKTDTVNCFFAFYTLAPTARSPPYHDDRRTIRNSRFPLHDRDLPNPQAFPGHHPLRSVIPQRPTSVRRPHPEVVDPWSQRCLWPVWQHRLGRSSTSGVATEHDRIASRGLFVG